MTTKVRGFYNQLSMRQYRQLYLLITLFISVSIWLMHQRSNFISLIYCFRNTIDVSIRYCYNIHRSENSFSRRTVPVDNSLYFYCWLTNCEQRKYFGKITSTYAPASFVHILEFISEHRVHICIYIYPI